MLSLPSWIATWMTPFQCKWRLRRYIIPKDKSLIKDQHIKIAQFMRLGLCFRFINPNRNQPRLYTSWFHEWWFVCEGKKCKNAAAKAGLKLRYNCNAGKRQKEMRVTAAFRLGDKENDDLVSFSSRIVRRVTQVRFFFASSTSAPVLSWQNYLALDEWVSLDKW